MRRILVALDGSPRAPSVLAAASEVAAQSDAKLLVFRAIGVAPDFPRELLELTDQRLEDVLTRNAREDLSRLVRDVPADRIDQIVTTFATPWDGIWRTGRELDVDLIVIGSHGYGALDRFLGTTASKVVNHADRNVLVVRARA